MSAAMHVTELRMYRWHAHSHTCHTCHTRHHSFDERAVRPCGSFTLGFVPLLQVKEKAVASSVAVGYQARLASELAREELSVSHS